MRWYLLDDPVGPWGAEWTGSEAVVEQPAAGPRTGQKSYVSCCAGSHALKKDRSAWNAVRPTQLGLWSPDARAVVACYHIGVLVADPAARPSRAVRRHSRCDAVSGNRQRRST